MSCHIGIVAHALRAEMAEQLYRQVDADFRSLDLGRLGCLANHLSVWDWHVDHPTEWAVTLEDDAVPIDGFRDQLDAALAVAPAPIVSLYYGRGYVDDTRRLALVQRAESMDVHWLLAQYRILHAVGLAVRRELLTSMIADLSRYRHRAVDSALAQWARRNHHEVAYTVPSLVDHRDEPSLVIRHRRTPRTAWRTGGHEEWTNRSLSMV